MDRTKAKKRRGRPRERWVEALQNDVQSQFDRLQKLGVKLSITSIQFLAFHVIPSSDTDAYRPKMIDSR